MSQSVVVQKRVVNPMFSSRQSSGAVPMGHLRLAKHWTIAAGFGPCSPGLDHPMISGPLGVPGELTAGVCRRAGKAWLTGESQPPWQETSLL